MRNSSHLVIRGEKFAGKYFSAVFRERIVSAFILLEKKEDKGIQEQKNGKRKKKKEKGKKGKREKS